MHMLWTASRPRLLLVGLLAVLLCGSSAMAKSCRVAQNGVEAWVTRDDHRLRLAQQCVGRTDAREDAVSIEVDAQSRHQVMLGVGASLTDSSAWLIQHRLDIDKRDALLRELFSSEDGLGLGLIRLTVGSSDFSRDHYSLNDLSVGEEDRQQSRFSIDINRMDVIPVAREALKINPTLQIMASPWSPPGWMKTTGSLIGGTLREEHFDSFAAYFLSYLDAYAKEGIPIFAITLQNEPSFEPTDYPGMRLSASQRIRLIADHLGPALAARQSPTRIYEWDHNWDKPHEPLEVLADERARRHIAGVAWHCYDGDISAQSLVHDRYPNMDVLLTECSGGDWEPVRSGGLAYQTSEIIINAARHWASGMLFWNLALDQDAGPFKGGCMTCRGVVTIDSVRRKFRRNDEYYALAHFSRFVARGAVRIGSSGSSDGVDNVAFLAPDGGSVILIASNRSRKARRLRIQQGALQFEHQVPKRSIVTYRWPLSGQASADSAAGDDR